MKTKKEMNHQELKYFNIPVSKNGISKTFNVFNDIEENIINDIKQSNGICLFYETNKDYLEKNGCQLKVYFIKHNLSHVYSKFYGPIFNLCGKHLKKINDIFNIDFLSDGVKWLEKKEFNKTSEYIFEYRKTQKNYNVDFPLSKNLKNFFGIDEINDFFDSEKRFWQDYSHIIGLPFSLLVDFKIKNFIGNNSKLQGSQNGPDFIFENEKKETIGLEIVEIEKLNYNSFKDETIYQKQLKKNISKNFNDILNDAADAKRNKELKLNLYQKTDKIYLGIVVPPTVHDWLILLIELILNKKTKFDGVFIL